jgi:hypothetical protein
MDRKTCIECGKNPRAINYKKDDKIYYRRICDVCITKQKSKRKPRWQTQGYLKKTKCEACGFVPKFNEQLTVYDYKDNFKTICLNCESAVKISNKLDIKKGDLKPDF